MSGNYNEQANIDGHMLALVPGPDPIFIAGYNLSGGVVGYAGLGSGGDDQNGIATDSYGNIFICSDYTTRDHESGRILARGAQACREKEPRLHQAERTAGIPAKTARL